MKRFDVKGLHVNKRWIIVLCLVFFIVGFFSATIVGGIIGLSSVEIISRAILILGEPGINTLSNIILVGALVIVTWGYAKKINEQTDFMIRDRKRRQILDEVQKVVSLFIDMGERTIRNIDKPYYGWFYDREGVGHLSGINELNVAFEGRTAIKDLYKKNQVLESEIESYNNRVSELEEKIKKVTEEIAAPDFIKLCMQTALEFNNSKEDAFKIRGELDNIHQTVISRVLDDISLVEKQENTIEPLKAYWNEYSDTLLKIREKEGISEQLLEIEVFCNGLKASLIDIRDMLFDIREKYRTEFNLTEDELEPRNKIWEAI